MIMGIPSQDSSKAFQELKGNIQVSGNKEYSCIPYSAKKRDTNVNTNESHREQAEAPSILYIQ